MRTNRLSRIVVLALLLTLVSGPAAFSATPLTPTDGKNQTFSPTEWVAGFWSKLVDLFATKSSPTRLEARETYRSATTSQPTANQIGDAGQTRFMPGVDPTGLRAE